MPSLQWYGRSWHIATDLLPVPIAIGAASHVVLVIVYGSLIGYYNMFRGCDAGNPQIATAASLLAIFAASLLSETTLVVITSRGTALRRSSFCQPLQAQAQQQQRQTNKSGALLLDSSLSRLQGNSVLMNHVSHKGQLHHDAKPPSHQPLLVLDLHVWIRSPGHRIKMGLKA